MQITMKKDALVALLKDRLDAARAEDVRKEKEHKADEQAALKKFRETLRGVLKLPYDQAKRAGRYNGMPLEMNAPACPVRESPEIARILYLTEQSSAKQFTVKTDTDLHRAISYQPASERVGKTVCD